MFFHSQDHSTGWTRIHITISSRHTQTKGCTMLLDVYRIQISYTWFKPFLHTFVTVMFLVTDQQNSWKKGDSKSFVSTNTMHSLHMNHNNGRFYCTSSDTLICQLITFESSQLNSPGAPHSYWDNRHSYKDKTSNHPEQTVLACVYYLRSCFRTLAVILVSVFVLNPFCSFPEQKQWVNLEF